MHIRLFTIFLIPLLALPIHGGDHIPPTTTVTNAPLNELVELDGSPLVGAKVYPVRFRQEQRWVQPPAVPCDSEGKFRLPDPDVTTVIILPPASRQSGRAIPFYANVSKSAPTRIVRPASVPLHIRFLDGEGKPLVGREVMVFPQPPDNPKATDLPADSTAFVIGTGFPSVPPELKAALSAQTDATGTAIFDALPQNARVSLTIVAAPEIHRPLVLAGSILVRPIPAPSVTIRVPLNRGITGQVRHLSTGTPLEGARVTLYEPGYRGGLRALGPTTDKQGRFHFTGLYPATYSLSFDGQEGHGEDRYLQAGPSTVTLTAQQASASQDILVVKAATVTVTVRDSAKRPVFAQEVTLDGKNGGGGGLTDIQGRMTLSDLPGNYHVTWTPGPGRHTQIRKPITLFENDKMLVRFGPEANKAEANLRAIAPDFAARDITGKILRLSQFAGKVVVLDFVYLTDEANRMSALQQAEAVARRLAPSRVVFLAVCSSADEGSKKSGWLTRALARRKAQFPHIRFVQDASGKPGEPDPTTRYHISGWPQRFVIGPDRTLRNNYGSSDYGATGNNFEAINDPKRLLTDVRDAL